MVEGEEWIYGWTRGMYITGLLQALRPSIRIGWSSGEFEGQSIW